MPVIAKMTPIVPHSLDRWIQPVCRQAGPGHAQTSDFIAWQNLVPIDSARPTKPYICPRMSQVITAEIIGKALSFDDYLALTESIISSPSPQGVYANEKTFRYTQSNLERMQKVLGQMVLQQKLYNLLGDLQEKWVWLVISEPWCGDASWGTPALYIISKACEHIDFRILLRDSNPQIMEAYQTNGSDSIPKLVCLKADNLKELGTWGPRRKPCRIW